MLKSILFAKKRKFSISRCIIFFIVKKLSFLAIKNKRYVTERYIRRFFLFLYCVYHYFFNFIDFWFWLVLTPTSIDNVFGYGGPSCVNNLSFSYYTAFTVVVEDWWSDDLNWGFYYRVVKTIKKVLVCTPDFFDFIFL